MRRLFLILLFVMVAARSLAQAQVLLSIRDTTLTRGSTALIPVRVDSSLTGLAVSSYQLDIRFTSGVIDVDSAISAGSMTQSWGAPTSNVSPGRIVVAGAASDTLSGTGILLFLKISLPLSATSTYAYLQFASALLNQGVPATVTRNSTLYILNLPSITVVPNGALLTVGETTQFSVIGGTTPYSWSTTNPQVASITSSGLLTGISAGTCQVVARDTNLLLDTSGQVEIRAFKLMLRDTSILQGQTFLLPIYCSDLNLVDVFSGQFSVSYNQNILTALGTDENGALLQQYGSSTVGLTPGRITVSFAGSSRLNGVGVQVLVYLRFAVSDTNAGSTNLNISNLVFNQDVLGNVQNAYFTALTRAALSVSPSSGTLIAGDSLQFNVIGTPVLPLTWLITDTTIATISNTGLLRAIRNGVLRVSVVDSVGASGSSGNISIYDMRVSVRDTSATPGDTVDVGIEVGSFAPGMSSVQLRVSFNQTYLNAIGVATTATLSDGWATSFSSPSPGVFSLAAAGANTVTGPGTLLNIRFTIADSAYQAAFPVTLSSVLLNEGNPLGLPVNGQIFVFVTAPLAPLLSSPPNGALNQPTTLTLSWGAPAGARRYRLQVSTDSLFGTTVFDDSTIAGTSRQVGPLASSTKHFWRVNARNSAGTSPYSLVRNFTTGAGAPAAPTLASPSNGATNLPVTLTLAWNASAGAATYRLQVSTDSLFGTSVFNDSTISGTSQQVGPLANSTTYYWRVNGKNGAGTSPSSQVRNFTTAAVGIFFVIYPGDANNDGIADVRDILPIGLYYNRTGPARQNPSIAWTPPDTLRQAWNPVQACYADCDGNGVVEAADVVPLVQNWYSTQSGGPVAGANRRLVCEELLRGIDGQQSSSAMKEIRSVIVGYMKTQLGIAFDYTLEQNWPNPFNPSTVIRFNIPEAQPVVGLSIYNTLGQIVWEQRLTDLQPGRHEVTWSGESTTGVTASSGVYLYRLSAGSYTSVRRMILLK